MPKGPRDWSPRERPLNREQMIDRMIRDDIGSIRRSLEESDVEFLDSVLRGEGWIPYNKLSDAQIESEYEGREDDIEEWEPVYDDRYGKNRNE